jgi:hypothetical protein
MAIPTTTADQIREAIVRFDDEVATSPELEKWQDDKNHKFAINFDGKLYPVKKLFQQRPDNRLINSAAAQNQSVT